MPNNTLEKFSTIWMVGNCKNVINYIIVILIIIVIYLIIINNKLDRSSLNVLLDRSNDIINYSIIGLIIIAFIYLTVLSIYVADLKYPREHPWLFTLETLIFSIGCGAIIFLMDYGRDKIKTLTFVQFLLISLKFGILTILLQFSGYYTYIFNS
jgi:hypothetical protein